MGEYQIPRRAQAIGDAWKRWKRHTDRNRRLEADRVCAQIVTALAPLVHKFAWKLKRGAATAEDLAAVGNTAIAAALPRYDPAMGTSVLTFLHTAVRAQMLRYLNSVAGDVIRQPEWLQLTRRKVIRAEAALSEKRLPATPEAIAEMTGVPLRQVRQVLWTRDHFAPLLRFGAYTDYPRGEVDPERHSAFAVEWTEAADTRLALSPYLHRLPPLLQEILLRRFWDQETLGSIGQDMGISRERVRQLEASALARLRKIVPQDTF